MLSTIRERGRLFSRPQEPRPVSFGVRELGLLKNLARLRLASSAQLAALDGGSVQNVSRALLALYENGYVERPLAQVTSRLLYQGSYPTVYGLTRRGARVLRQHGEEVRRRLLDGIDKERGAGWRFIDHTVSIAGFWVGLEVATRNREDIRILERGEILEDAPKAKRDRLVRLEASVRLRGVLKRTAVIPDALFGLRINDEREQFFMVEIDRGEMPIERFRNTERTYFAKKMLTYYEANRQRRHVYDLGIPNFRILTVTTDRRRIERMLEAQRGFTEGRGSNLFLFVDERTLSESDPLRVDWIGGRGERVRLGA